RDILVPGATTGDLLELRAVSGATGKTMWRRARINDGLNHQSLQNWTSPTVCDFEGDGAAEVVVVEPVAPSLESGDQHFRIAITTLRAADGQPLATQPTDARFLDFRGYSHTLGGELLHPIRLRRSGGREH